MCRAFSSTFMASSFLLYMSWNSTKKIIPVLPELNFTK